MKQDRFPLVSDDEIMLTKMPVMDLYDESDFISNIKGDYRDKKRWSSATTAIPRATAAVAKRR